ncbi:MAG: sensor histidine kinase [Planctomycetes bacterium]|nr:sensor histidine kinase [Planctomycetota bacterium]
MTQFGSVRAMPSWEGAAPRRPPQFQQLRRQLLQHRKAFHDLRNLLSAVGMKLGGLCDGVELQTDKNAGTLRSVVAARDAVVQCLEIIDGARQVPVIGDGATCDTTRTMLRVAGLLNQLAPDSVSIRVLDPYDGLRPVHAVETELTQAILELGQNALKALAATGGTITLSAGTRRLDRHRAEQLNLVPGRYHVVIVDDDGDGMDGEIIELAMRDGFSTFGTDGQGLANVRRFAVENGGTLALASQPNAGTAACLYLPDAQTFFSE